MSDNGRFDEVRIDGFDDHEEVCIPLRDGDDVPALLREIADAWDIVNGVAKQLGFPVPECRHVWDDSALPGPAMVCLVCGVTM
jgi:hypothetical protein